LYVVDVAIRGGREAVRFNGGVRMDELRDAYNRREEADSLVECS
jgi:hypothetical protein